MVAFKFDTVLPADSLEFCPHSSAQNIFVCGTYSLEQENAISGPEIPKMEPQRKQHRRGACLVFEISSDGEGENAGQFRQIQEISLPAVPDMKWCHRSPSTTPILGIADSEGNVTLHEWREDERQMHLTQSISCAPSDVLCLSLDWSNRRSPTSTVGHLIVSLSNGNLCLLRPTEAALSATDTWPAHDYEPWIAAWNYWDTSIIYSGGDDLKMKGWDTRQGFSQPIFVNRQFDAGVTTIQSHPYIEHLIAVGSYDNTVRLFDTRKPLVPLRQAEVGGGAWRVKWHPSPDRKGDLLVACMHDGFKVVRFDLGQDLTMGLPGWEVVNRFDAHTSLAYGVDWSFAENETDKTMVGSCSFYDHTLQLWGA